MDFQLNINCEDDIYFLNPFSDLKSDSREKDGSDDILRWIRVLDRVQSDLQRHKN